MKNRIAIIIIIFLLFIIVSFSFILYMLGKPANIKTDTQLDGVNEDIENALYYASFAANSHNSQCWKLNLDIQSQQLTIFLDEERALNIVDPEYRELYISLGCYIESMIYAFDAYGYGTAVEYAEPIGIDNEIATISFYRHENGKINNEQIELIQRRHTDKTAYHTDKIDSEVISELLKDHEGIYYYEIGSEKFDYLKIGTLEAITEQSYQSTYLEELNLWMRFSNREVEQKKDGVSAEMIGLNGIIKAFYYLTTNHTNAVNDTFAEQGLETAKKQLEHCSAFFIVTGNDTIVDWIEAGRKTQAFWYECVKNNIAIQPISAMLEIAPYNQRIQNDLMVPENVQMILRAGYVDEYGENLGVRRNLNEYITVINTP